MRKAFYILSAAVCFGCMYSNNLKAEANVQTVGFGTSGILGSKSVSDGPIGLKTEDFKIDNKNSDSNKLSFNLKISIPKGYVLGSNEHQDAGKSLEIKLKETTNEILNIRYPLSEDHSITMGKTQVVNHIYHDSVPIPVEIINPKDKNILEVSYQLCGGENNECFKPTTQQIVVNK
jgi:hypothetical protein